MHEGQSCNGMDNTDISLPMAFVHTASYPLPFYPTLIHSSTDIFLPEKVDQNIVGVDIQTAIPSIISAAESWIRSTSGWYLQQVALPLWLSKMKKTRDNKKKNKWIKSANNNILSGKQAVETVVRAESQCFRFSQAGRNITIVPGSVFGMKRE